MEVNKDPKPKSKVQGLYDILSKDSKYNQVIPSFPEFEKKLQDERFAGEFYDILKRDPKYKASLPEKDKFVVGLQVEKKNLTQVGPDVRDVPKTSSEVSGDGSTQAGNLKEQLDAGDLGPLSEQARAEVLASETGLPPLSENIVREGAPELTEDRIQEIKEGTTSDKKVSEVTNVVSQFDRGAYGLIPDVLDFLGQATYGINKSVTAPLGLEEELESPEQTYLGQAAKVLRDKLFELTPVNKEDAGNMSSQVANGLGQLATFYLSAGIGSASKAPQLAQGLSKTSTTKEVAKQVYNAVTSRTSQLASMQMASQGFKEAKEAGADDKEAFMQWLADFGIGKTEAIPVANALSRLNKATNGGFQQYLINTGKGAIEEGIQESVQEYLSNLSEKEIYNEGKNLLDNVFESGEIGGITGLVANAVINALPGRAPKLRSYAEQKLKEQQEVVDKSVDQLEETITTINANTNETQSETTNEGSDVGPGDTELADVEPKSKETGEVGIDSPDADIEIAEEQVNPQVDKSAEEVNLKADKPVEEVKVQSDKRVTKKTEQNDDAPEQVNYSIEQALNKLSEEDKKTAIIVLNKGNFIGDPIIYTKNGKIYKGKTKTIRQKIKSRADGEPSQEEFDAVFSKMKADTDKELFNVSASHYYGNWVVEADIVESPKKISIEDAQFDVDVIRKLNEKTTDDRGAQPDVIGDAAEESVSQDLNPEADQKVNEEGDNTDKPADKADKVRPGQRTKFVFHDGVGREGEIIEDRGDKVLIKGDNGNKYSVSKTQLVSEEEAKAREEVSKKLPESTEIIDQDLDKIIADTPKKRKDKAEVTAKNLINPLKPVFQALDASQKAIGKILRNPAKRTEDFFAKKINEGLKSQNYAVRNVAGTLKNIAGGLAYTEQTAKNKREYNGLKNYANFRAQKMMSDMYKIVDDDVVALASVHAVLDPEVYQDTEYKGKTYEDLNEKEKKLFEILKNTNNYIHDYHFGKGFIDLDTYNKFKDKYVARLYEEFELANTPDDMKEMFKRSKADFGMFTKRKDFEDVQSSILRDPVYATAKRVGQMIQNQAILEYTDKIAKSKDIKVSDEEFPGSTKLAHSGRWPVYGALTNKYVPNYIAEDFKGYFFANKALNSLYDAFRGYDKLKLRQILKKSHTVYNPLTRMGNIVSNFSFAFWTNVDPVTFFSNRSKAKKAIKEGSDKYVDLIKAGLIGTEIITGDLSPLSQKNKESTVIQKIDNKIAEVFSKENRISKGLKKLDNWFTDTYGKADDVSKLSAYISLTEDYGLNKDEAISQVYEGFQNYSSVGKMYDLAAKTPVIGNPYIKFKADLARILKNTITKRPLTGAAYLALLYWIKDVFSDASGEDDIIQEARERRPFIPKVKTPLGDIALVWQVPGIGEVNFARYITPYYMYDKGSKEDLVNLTTEWLPYQLEMVDTPVKNIKVPFPELPDVFLGTYAQVAIDRDFRGKSIRDPRGNKFKSISTPNEQIINAMTYIARSQVPMFASAQNFYDAYTGNVDYYGRERTVAQAILNNFIKVQDFGEEEVRKQLTNEIEYKVSLFDSYQKDIAIVKKDTKDRITEIYQREKISQSKKEELAAKEVKAMQDRIQKLLEKQVEIVKEIEDPSKLLEKVVNK